MELKDRLLQIRKSLNKTQPEIAELVGVSRQMVSEYENGHTEPGTDVIAKYSTVSGKSVLWIRTGEEEPNQHVNEQKHHVYRANSAFPERLQFTLEEMSQIAKLREESPVLYKILEFVMKQNDQLMDYVQKLQATSSQKQNE